MDVEVPGRLVLVARDQDERIVDCFLGPHSREKLPDALVIAHALLTSGRRCLVKVEIHPSAHSTSGYVLRPLAVLTKEDLVAEG